MTSYSFFLKFLAVLCATFPSYVLGKGGGGKGGGKGGILTALSEPLVVILAFCGFFAFLSTLQVAGALRNIYKRTFRAPDTVTPREFTVGPIFPGLLVLSALTLVVFYVLDALSWAFTLSATQRLSSSFFIALNVFAYLPDILIVSSVLAVLTHREQILVKTPPMLRWTKMTFDAILCVTLLSLSATFVGLSTVATTSVEGRTADNTYVAYCIAFLASAVDVTISSIIICVRSRRALVGDRKIVLLVACVVSPLLLILAVYPIVLQYINLTEAVIASYEINMASIIISCITRFIVVTICMWFGRASKEKSVRRQG